MISSFLKRASKLTIDNSPVLLTGIGVVGTIATAILSGKASFKAAQIIYEERINDSYPEAPSDVAFVKEDINIVWKFYILPIGTGALTIASIIASNRIGTRRAVALAAAYSVSERAFVEYREKVVERLGQNKEQKIRDEIAQDRVDKHPSNQVIITGANKVLCFDSITGRYFESDMESLRKAQNDINQQIINNMYATLHEFYTLVGLPPTAYSSEVGWNASALCELTFSATLAEDGRPCIAIDYSPFPIRDYY